MKKVIIIQYPSISHLNASFKIAELLKENGYDIYYFVEQKMANYVINHGFKYYINTSIPIVEEFDKTAMKNLKIKYGYYEILRDAVIGTFFNGRKEALNQLISSISPDIIISDTFAGADFALIYPLIKQRNIKFFHIETMLSSIDRKGIPYLTGTAFPGQTFKISFERLKRSMTKKSRRLWRSFIYMGHDNYSLLKREAVANGIPDKYRIESSNYMDFTFTNISSLITAPIELEFFPPEPQSRRHHLGFFINESSGNIPLTDELEKITNTGKKVIYISFGTVFVERDAKSIIKFMKKLNTALQNLSEVTAIFSLGKAKWKKADIDSLTHINIFEYIPQVSLLPKCALFITHGGLNSIKESIETETPMLIFPLDIDQIGNARKIAYKKLGRMGDKSDSVKQIQKNISILLNDNEYKRGICDFRQKIIDRYNIESRLINIIETEGQID